MSKVSRYLLVVFLAIFSSLFLAGCGGDKLVGTYITYIEETSFGSTSYRINLLDIEKNGNEYIVKPKTLEYKPKTQRTADVANLEFKSSDWDIRTGTFKDNTLDMDGEKLIYIEKDDTIKYKGKTYTRLKNETELEDLKKKMYESALKEGKRLEQVYKTNVMRPGSDPASQAAAKMSW